MTVSTSIDPARLLEEQLAQASPDPLRELFTFSHGKSVCNLVRRRMRARITCHQDGGGGPADEEP